ncbi:MAG: beta strand repeat-containing protein, partial [Tepidisphaerales bacterium]
MRTHLTLSRFEAGRARHLLALAAALAILQGRSFPVAAATVNWTDGTSNWSLATNWTTLPSAHNVPGAGDTVNIALTDGVSRTITYDYTGAAVTLGSLTLDLTGGSGSATTLSMAANSLTANGETIGNSGSGTLTQTAGTNTDNGGFGVGSQSGSNGTYNLSGTGALIANGGAAVGLSGTGTFNQTGGTNTINVGNLNIGYGSGSTGTYHLSSGTAKVSNGSVFVGGNPSGPGGTGNLTISGSGVLTTSSTGTVTVYNTAGSGLALSGGGTINTGSLYFWSSPGSFNWTAGTLNWNNPNVGLVTEGLDSTLTIGAGQTLTVASSETLGTGYGPSDSGAVNQTGGTNTINGGNLYIDANYLNYGITGSYTLSGGTLAVNGGGSVYVGGTSGGANGGIATFTISGTGAATISGTLKIMNMYFGSSIVNLSGGTLSAGVIDVSGNTSFLNWTAGTLNFTATNLVFDATITGAPNAPFNANTTLTSTQTLIVSGGTETIGGGGSASLTLNSATNTVSGNVTIQSNGTLTLNGAAALTVGGAAGLTNLGTFTLNGGTITVGGGTGNVTNSGLFVYNSGTFNARLVDQGEISLTANFVAGNGIENESNIALTSTQIITANGAGFSNDGTLALNGGILAGTQFANNSDGVVVGPGTITATFTNSGTLNVPSGTTKVGSFTNNGVIEMASSAGSLGPGGTVTNAATIEGFGRISDTVNNNATIRPIGGTLVFTGPVTNSASGLISIPANGEVLMQGPSNFATNAGIISLAGGTFDNGGQLLSNTGQITGYGV